MDGMVEGYTEHCTQQSNTRSVEGSAVRVALLLEYLGTPFSGSQYQSQGENVLPTIQSSLKEALASLNLKSSAVNLSGRTDAGVHAVGQVAHFDIYSPNAFSEQGLRNIPALSSSLNAMLPASISVKLVKTDVSSRFHSQLDATHRWYRYVVFNRPERSALAPLNSTWVRQPLDADKMNQAAALLKGTHNFRAFRCSDTAVMNDVCQIFHSSVRREGDRVIYDVVSNRFLYKMVRNLMGLLISIGKDDSAFTFDNMLDVLESQDRTRYSWATARPEGLTLMAVNYPAALNYFHKDENVQQLQQMIMMESKQDENLFRKAS